MQQRQFVRRFNRIARNSPQTIGNPSSTLFRKTSEEVVESARDQVARVLKVPHGKFSLPVEERNRTTLLSSGRQIAKECVVAFLLAPLSTLRSELVDSAFKNAVGSGKIPVTSLETSIGMPLPL